MKITRFLSVAVIGSLLSGFSAVSAKTVLTLSTPDSDTSEITLAAKEFAKIVADKTKGDIEIKVFANGTLYGGDPGAAVKQLGSGALDMLLLSSSLYANFNPQFTAISVPYLFDSMDQIRGYLGSDMGKELLASLRPMNIEALGFWPRPFRQITTSKRFIKAPADLEGLKLRVPNNPLWVEFFGKMKAVPTPMAFAEVYNALQLKVVDGQENPVNVPAMSKFFEVQKYLTFSNHIADAWVVGVNQKKWEKLPDTVKQALIEASIEAEARKVASDQAQEAKDEQLLISSGMESYHLTPDEQKAFVEVAKQLYPRFSELVKDKAFFDRTLEYVGKK